MVATVHHVNTLEALTFEGERKTYVYHVKQHDASNCGGIYVINVKYIILFNSPYALLISYVMARRRSTQHIQLQVY